MDKGCFTLEMAVRDYECDLQGVVNNAVYQNYLEHARHEYLKDIGIDFAALAAQRINLVVTLSHHFHGDHGHIVFLGGIPPEGRDLPEHGVDNRLG